MRRMFLGLMLLVTMFALPVAALGQPVFDQTPPGAPRPATTPKPDQQPPPPPPAPPAPPAPAPRTRMMGQPLNVKVEFTINDQFGAAAPVQKTVSLILADRMEGMIRSEGVMPGYGSVQLNVDAEIIVSPPSPQQGFADKILARLGLSYDLVDPKASSGERQARTTQIREHLTVLLESGKPLVLSQSADPLTDRKVTVEVKATVLK